MHNKTVRLLCVNNELLFNMGPDGTRLVIARRVQKPYHSWAFPECGFAGCQERGDELVELVPVFKLLVVVFVVIVRQVHRLFARYPTIVLVVQMNLVPLQYGVFLSFEHFPLQLFMFLQCCG